jgi:hypothetical protein
MNLPVPGAGEAFAVKHKEADKVVESVTALLGQALTAVRDLQGVSIDRSAFAKIGSQVADANDQLRQHIDGALQTLLKSCGEVNKGTGDDLDTYRHNDQCIADATMYHTVVGRPNIVHRGQSE